MMFEWLLPPTMNYVSKYCKCFVKCHHMHLTMQMLRLYGCMMEEVRSVITTHTHGGEAV